MKLILYPFLAILLTAAVACGQPAGNRTPAPDPVTLAVDPAQFLSASLAEPVTRVPCTLSDGTQTDCYQIVATSVPTDHRMGPWCPDHISDDAAAGGIWLEDGEVYDVDGAFIARLAEFYDDDTWRMYDDNGNIHVTDSREDCANAANPNVGPEHENFCVECLPSYVTDLTQTYLIPVTPVKLAEANAYGRGGPRGLAVRGIAFNGIRFDAPAPTDAILGAYTLAPFDDAGGHINLHAGYHYHAATGQTTEIAQPDGHAPMIGYAIDGHGLYARLDGAGTESTDLDDCRGHFDTTRGYHYHVDAAGANNFINCLSGAYARD
ncbi:YHYH protein [Lewinella sp. JB7]|uniref:YHYH protein n=1 Tax=Lewinella sp. JB7 TaxID=2962887 RepID=UPI0020C9CCEC|nr:YHYH protein [Lewinella sp. JB7]MCP9236927.1 YHYH protein [Lewinella sp. JB7]